MKRPNKIHCYVCKKEIPRENEQNLWGFTEAFFVCNSCDDMLDDIIDYWKTEKKHVDIILDDPDILYSL